VIETVLGPVTWETLSLGGVCSVLTLTLVRMVVSGKFVPEAQVERLLAGERATNAYLKSALEKRDEANAALVQQVAKLTVQGDATVRVLQALPTAQSGSDHVATTTQD
jgi:hypothetical protein